MSRNGLCTRSILLASLGLCLMAALPAHGTTLVSIESVSAGPGTVGDSFDVVLTNTGPSATTVGSFTFNILTLDTDISFTDVTTGTTAATYIFPSSFLGPDLTGPNTGQTFAVEPFDLSIAGDVTIGAGDTVGLGHVVFDVANGATFGTFAVTLGPTPAVTSLANSGGNVTIDALDDGDIMIVSPEPATVLPAGLAFLVAAAARRRLRRRQ
jgi:hypothetical protein